MVKHTIREELSAVLAFVGFIWLAFIIGNIPGLGLTNYGIVPRTTAGLIGILTAPFLHANLAHIASNTIPLIVLLVLLAGSRAASWAIVLWVVLLSGALLWLFGRPANHIGASGLIYGLVAYLFISGIRERRFVPLAIALLVGFLYGGSMASGIVPRLRSQVSWDGHLFGAIAGGAIAYRMTRRSDADRDRPRISPPGDFPMRSIMFALFCNVLAVESFAQTERPDWHTGDYAGRDLAMWRIISKDLKTSFPRGGAPVEVKPFLQDDRLIFPLPDGESNAPRSLAKAGERTGVILHTSGGQFYFDGKSLLPEPKAAGEVTETFNGASYAVRNDRLVRLESGNAIPILDFGRDGLPDDEVRDIALSSDGEFYAATASGIGILSKDGKWRHLTGRNGGLPVEDVTCLSFAPDGTLWVGTTVGAARRWPNGEWNYRMGPRWMLADEVIDILATSQGGAYILTQKSLTHLFTRKMTLREKAKHYDAIARARHVRHGAMTSCNLRDVNDFDSWYMTDSDNDGLWTSIYLGAKCFEYAATRDPEAKRIAKRHFDFLHRLETINGIPGFVARSLRPSKDSPGGHEEYHYGGEGEWHESTVEPGWQWKADTSSDELSGHFFAWGVYYDYVAKGDPAEERRVEELVRRVTNHIIDHDFTLTDVDGHPTRWAIYSPRLLHGDLMWSDQVGFNALGIVAHLKVAIHICGDQKFKDAYRMLIDRWGYNVKAMFAKEMLPNTPGAGVNHSDDEMAWLEYYHLLLYPDEDERLRWQYRYSASRSMRPEIPERSPLFNFVFATDSPHWAHVADGVDTLKRWPIDLRQFETRNSHRADVIVDLRRGRHGNRLLLEPVPIDERVPKKWNHDPYVADDGGDGSHEESGAEWLMPYWMAVYHKLIVEVE